MNHRRGETVQAAQPRTGPPASHHLPRPIVILGAVLLVLVAVAVAVVRDLGSSAPRAQAIMLPERIAVLPGAVRAQHDQLVRGR